MVAFGPIFQEQDSFESHRPYRDQMATFENEIASYIRSQGFDVLGIHHRGAPVKQELLDEIKYKALEFVHNKKR